MNKNKTAVICVDDEPIILISMIEELKKHYGDTYVFEIAMDAEQAMRIADDLEADGIRIGLLISDWIMPGISGETLLSMMAAKYPSMKTIVMSGYADTNSVKKAEKSGLISAVLSKPWSIVDMTEAIDACMRLSIDQE